MSRQTHRFAAVWVATAGLALVACGGTSDPGTVPDPSAPPQPEGVFVDVAAETGLEFAHFNGMTGELYLTEMMAPGVALFDYDDDGDLDVFIVQGKIFEPGKTEEDLVLRPEGPLGHRLFRNDLEVGPDGSRTLRFTDVSDRLGFPDVGYAMGLASGDFDNDGLPDLYMTSFGPNQLLRNNGDGSFADITERAGVGEDRWSVSAAFVDFDADGWLDLYVGNYLDLTHQNHRKCFNVREDYCNPRVYNPVPDRLFRNRGDGTFEDVSASSHIAGEYGGALGIVAADFDGNGRLDLYVANDGKPNQLWMNRGSGRFENTALLAGCALNEMGEAEAGMGLDAGDVDNDGDFDLFMSHLATETNTLYINDGSGIFEDATIRADLASDSLSSTGFGLSLFDFDNDGHLDILVVNGAVTILEDLAIAGDPFPIHQPNLLFRNAGNGRFENWTDRGGEVFELSEVSRGAAFGDIDNDGDTDVVIGNNAGPARLLLNRIGNRNHWIGLRVMLDDPPRDALGARVEVVRPDGPSLWRRVRTDGSYASANDPRVLVGLGGGDRVDVVRVTWPDGSVEAWREVEVDRWQTLRRGTGEGVE